MYSINSCGQSTMGGPPARCLDEGLTTSHRKKSVMQRLGICSTGPVVDSCEHGNNISGSMKDGKFLDQLSDC
jgi:hypothetical protein